MPNQPPIYYEGSTNGKDLLDTIHDIMTGQPPFNVGRDNSNKWVSSFQVNNEIWVEYSKNTRLAVGTYKHEDGRSYTVYKLKGATGGGFSTSNYDSATGILYEVFSNSLSGTGQPVRTGRTFQMKQFDIIDKNNASAKVDVDGAFVCKTIDNKLFVLKQERLNTETGLYEENYIYNSFTYKGCVVEGPNTGDWYKILGTSTTKITYWLTRRTGVSYNVTNTSTMWEIYKFNETYFTAKTQSMKGNAVILSTKGSPPDGATEQTFNIMIKQPTNQYNYIDFYIGQDFNGSNSVGNSVDTYKDICDEKTVFEGSTPTIINPIKAEMFFNKQNTDSPTYKPPVESWKVITGGQRDVSGAAHMFYGTDFTYNGVKIKRQPLWGIRYKIWLTNQMAFILLEADRSPYFAGSYKSFAYVGTIDPLNELDYSSNFALTVSCDLGGDLPFDLSPSGARSIQYLTFGAGTGNGMLDINMLRSQGYTPYQAHFPSFLTQSPEYVKDDKKVKTIALKPGGQPSLDVTQNFQKSLWTGLYYASPIYVVHPVDGYRGELSNIVAILDINLLDGDELEVDTGEKKSGSEETWKAVYKFVKLDAPYSMFIHSPNPTTMTIAVFTYLR